MCRVSSGFNPQHHMNWVLWHTPLIPALRCEETGGSGVVILGYMSLRSTRATQKPVSNKTRKVSLR